MNFTSIDINYEELIQKIEMLKEEKIKFDNVLNNIKNDANGIQNYWTGNTGELATNNLKEYTNSFAYFSNKIERQINYLQAVAEAYKKMDALIIKKLEENGSISAV